MYYVYILTNKYHTVLYTGITNNLERRLYEHTHGDSDSFTKRYRTTKLVYFEETTDINAAIAREKQIKGWIRKKKENLIEQNNPEWKDLGEELEIVSSDLSF